MTFSGKTVTRPFGSNSVKRLFKCLRKIAYYFFLEILNHFSKNSDVFIPPSAYMPNVTGTTMFVSDTQWESGIRPVLGTPYKVRLTILLTRSSAIAE